MNHQVGLRTSSLATAVLLVLWYKLQQLWDQSFHPVFSTGFSKWAVPGVHVHGNGPNNGGRAMSPRARQTAVPQEVTNLQKPLGVLKFWTIFIIVAQPFFSDPNKKIIHGRDKDYRACCFHGVHYCSGKHCCCVRHNACFHVLRVTSSDLLLKHESSEQTHTSKLQ